MTSAVVVIALSVALSGTPNTGQVKPGTGVLKGIVFDEEGKAISSARVLLSPVAPQTGSPAAPLIILNEKALETSTDKEGLWQCDRLESGTWIITISKDGYGSMNTVATVKQLCDSSRMELWIDRLKGEAFSYASDLLGFACQLFSQRRFDEALPLFRHYLKKDRQAAMVELRIGDCLSAMGNQEEAIQRFQDVLRRGEGSPLNSRIAARAWSGMGMCYFKKGDHAEAIRCWTAAVEMSPTNDEVAANLADVLFAEEKPDEALRYLLMAIGISACRSDLYFKLGLVYLNKGSYPKAREAFRKVLEITPTGKLAEATEKMLADIDKHRLMAP